MNDFDWQDFETGPLRESVQCGAVVLRPGDQVRLRPRASADIMDIALAGKVAVIEAIEQDFEERIHLAVVVVDDPGRDLGMLRQPGHRFFFSLDEVEPLAAEEYRSEELRAMTPPPRTLVAGIGNIFLGDDAFGSEVARQLAARQLTSSPWPETVRVVDFGIRGFDLAYELLTGYELVILIDALPRGGAPGTLYTIQPDLGDATAEPVTLLDAHTMDPERVLRFVRSQGGDVGHVVIVGCEPTPLADDDDFGVALSPAVQAAIAPAVARVDAIIEHAREVSKLSPVESL